MPILARLTNLVRNLTRGAERDRDLHDELDSYVELLTEQKIGMGVDPQAARREALIELGGREVVKEQVRDRRIGHALTGVLQDLRYGLRVLRKNPGFTAVAVLTLSLGIGSSTAMFAVIEKVILRPFPYAESERLIAVSTRMGSISQRRGDLSTAEFYDLRERSSSLAGVAAYIGGRTFLMVGGETEPTFTVHMTHEALPLLGVPPLLGRYFTAEEDHPDAPQVAVISHRLWTSRYGADRDIVGSGITIDNKTYTVVGVMPAGFFFPLQKPAFDLFLPLRLTAEERTSRGFHFLSAFARPRDGVTPEQSQAEVQAIGRQLRDEYPETYAEMDFGMGSTPWLEYWVGSYRRSLLLLMSAVVTLLLIAMANVANLLLMRSTFRERELAVRMALGAGRARVFRQLLTESTLLSMLGGIGGLGLAVLAQQVLVRMYPGDMPRLSAEVFAGSIGWFVWGVSLFVGLVIGWLGAWRAAKGSLQPRLGAGGRGSTAQSQLFQRALVVSQVAGALVLLVCASLVVQSVRNLYVQETGFRTEDILTFRLGLPSTDYPEAGQVMDFYQTLADRLAARPEVLAASAAQVLPLRNRGSVGVYVGDSKVVPAETEQYHTLGIVLPDYFRTLDIPLRAGREFTRGDDAEAPAVAIVNESFVKRYWPGENALGKRIRIFGASAEMQLPWLEIVGVVGDTRNRGLDQPVAPAYYFPHRQTGLHRFNTRRSLALVVRTATRPLELVPQARSIVKQMDRTQPLLDVRSLRDVMDESVANRAFSMWLMASFTLLALLLSAVGIYGVLAYSVSQRVREIGVRFALGAHRRQLLLWVLRQGALLVAIGVVVGTAVAAAATRLLASLLFDVSPTSLPVFAASSAVLLVVALIACCVPALRAMQVDPIVALRSD